MRLKIPANFRIVRVPCTGKVDIIHVLRAFEKGADGVYVVGCMEGDCHYNEGNFRARKRIEQAAMILDKVGVGGERVKMFNLSSGEGPLFAQYSIEMNNKIIELGPSPIRVAKQNKKNAA
ncbi:MAG: hydrogenase iron-sulfur subunit [Desulfobacula sp.]|jgi:coenzyme F420-reducing hydrogenase delta subunit|nr:hydrogenase iron-sulfur subunit [Desulfobacula sp.]MBT3485210.1 hydrogenase iron-sulfur subunit [Desulfobacula sp.]MBT3804784.1 hydrogenase iron-sulfur subunit [Desulfobacula sp.]MBT4025261.1 hydrogenase iron-sulfur subunit [Desulfobacula sp.]MBT4200133.1 hydrogenase iron-sulfur subunit [Desulfobacula sp.]